MTHRRDEFPRTIWRARAGATSAETIAEAVAMLDRLFADKVRQSLSDMLSLPGDVDIDVVEELIDACRRDYQRQRAEIVAALEREAGGGQ